MGRTGRKKKRTHQPKDSEEGNDGGKTPQTFVIERGKVGGTLKQLVMDLRKVMEPYTAKHLKATKKNVLKDFVAVAGPMGVSHFMTVSKTSEHVYLKLARVPRGPTVTFRIAQFSLGKEVSSSSKKVPPVGGIHFLTPPVLVLNGFANDNRPCQLMSTMFQNMFPTIDVQKVKLSELRRCVIYSYDKTAKTVDFRHYVIKVVPRGMSRGVRKLVQSKLPNLAKWEDISEYILGGGGASESEGEDGEGEVTLGQDVPGRGNIKQQQSSVRLYEVGPRLTLQLIKIESGLCSGEVLHHELIHRSKEEVKALKKRIRQQKHLKLTRKKTQEDNVKRKRLEKEKKRKEERIRQGKKVDESDKEDEDNDEAWYREEVGVAPDPDLLLGSVNKYSKNVKRRKRDSSVGTSDQQTKKRKLSQQEKETPNKRKSSSVGFTKTSVPTKKRKFNQQSTKKPIKVVTGTVFRKKAQRTKN